MAGRPKHTIITAALRCLMMGLRSERAGEMEDEATCHSLREMKAVGHGPLIQCSRGAHHCCLLLARLQRGRTMGDRDDIILRRVSDPSAPENPGFAFISACLPWDDDTAHSLSLVASTLECRPLPLPARCL